MGHLQTYIPVRAYVCMYLAGMVRPHRSAGHLRTYCTLGGMPVSDFTAILSAGEALVRMVAC